MLLSRNWLAQYVDLPEDIAELSSRLTAAGFNVEEIKESAGDVGLDIEITTNRSDAMNHLGMARELAVIFDRALTEPQIDLADADGVLAAVPVTTDDLDDCPRYVARLVRGVKVGPSPDWLVERLESIGQRPINNIVDVTNFVLWETGQPLHGFDLDKLAGGEIRVRRATAGESLITLDGEARELDPETLVIADAERAVAVAGVMGGLDSEVTESTVDVLIESAHFEPQRVRRAARRLGLQTDASHRFERGTDPEICLAAATRAAALMCEVAGGEVAPGSADVRAEGADWRLYGSIELEALNRFAGVEIAAAEVERILSGLGYDPEGDGSSWSVRVPSWRYYDCEALRSDDPPTVWQADVYEEVMRLFGFDAIPSALPAIGAPDEGASAAHRLRERLRGRLSAAGLAEAINYAFQDETSDQRLPALVPEGTAIGISNPLSEKYDRMRRSLTPGLVETGLFNQRRGARAVRLYELGHVFTSAGSEFETMAIVCGGGFGEAWDRPTTWDLFALKGVIEALAAAAGKALAYRAADLRGLIDGTGAEIFAEGAEQPIGFLGQLDDDGAVFPLFVAEVATDALDVGSAVPQVEPPSRFPGIEVDSTLTHAVGVRWEEIAAAIERAEVPDLTESGLKDRYEGDGVPEGAVNTTIFFRYNAAERSMTQDEVNERHQQLVGELEETFGWNQGARE
jgi:phenylalanyl-tRNA synthetase beta chain